MSRHAAATDAATLTALCSRASLRRVHSQEAAFDKCVALTVDAFVACLYRRLRVMSMRGYR